MLPVQGSHYHTLANFDLEPAIEMGDWTDHIPARATSPSSQRAPQDERGHLHTHTARQLGGGAEGCPQQDGAVTIADVSAEVQGQLDGAAGAQVSSRAALLEHDQDDLRAPPTLDTKTYNIIAL